MDKKWNKKKMASIVLAAAMILSALVVVMPTMAEDAKTNLKVVEPQIFALDMSITSAEDFVGTWTNADLESGGMIKFVITEEDPEYHFRGYGACHPKPCDWGTTPLTLYSKSVSDTNDIAGTAEYDSGFNERRIYLVMLNPYVIMAYNFDKFTDASGRHNFASMDFFTKAVVPEFSTPTPTIPSGTVQGRVLWNEQTVKGATVYVTDLYSFDSTRYGSATTDANGHFSISDIPEGEQYLYVFGNQPEFWVTAVTPFQMVAGTGTLAKDTYLCKGFNPISPKDGQVLSTSRPILQWDAFPDAVDYAVRVIRVGESNFVFHRGDDDARIKGTSVQVDVDLSPGEYRWRVDGFNVEGHIIACSYYPRSFRVESKPQ